MKVLVDTEYSAMNPIFMRGLVHDIDWTPSIWYPTTNAALHTDRGLPPLNWSDEHAQPITPSLLPIEVNMTPAERRLSGPLAPAADRPRVWPFAARAPPAVVVQDTATAGASSNGSAADGQVASPQVGGFPAAGDNPVAPSDPQVADGATAKPSNSREPQPLTAAHTEEMTSIPDSTRPASEATPLGDDEAKPATGSNALNASADSSEPASAKQEVAEASTETTQSAQPTSSKQEATEASTKTQKPAVGAKSGEVIDDKKPADSKTTAKQPAAGAQSGEDVVDAKPAGSKKAANASSTANKPTEISAGSGAGKKDPKKLASTSSTDEQPQDSNRKVSETPALKGAAAVLRRPARYLARMSPAMETSSWLSQLRLNSATRARCRPREIVL